MMNRGLFLMLFFIEKQGQNSLVKTSENISSVNSNELWKCLKNQGKMSIFMNENGMKKVIYKYNLDLKMTYENKWELKPDYKNKWDNFLNYDMKNHDIHENKNVCPEFNGEKTREHQ